MPAYPPTAKQTLAEQVAPTPQEFAYTYMCDKARALIKDWEGEKRETELRRRQRKLEVSLEQLHQEGRLKADETLIAVRVIDENIRKEQPLYMNYLTGSRRLIIFKNKDVSPGDISQLETEVTEGLQYSNWQLPYFGVIDGAECHGWDSVEVVYNENKPLKVAVEHVGHDDLLFHRDALDIEACPFILRRYSMSPMIIQNMVRDFGFNAAQVTTLLDQQNSQSGAVQKNLCIYKIKFKVDGLVFVAWFEPDKCSDWLKAPEPFYNGRRKQTVEVVPTPSTVFNPATGEPMEIMVPQEVTKWVDEQETLYYVSLFEYIKTEEKVITRSVGRCFYDLPYQEAATALASLYVNGNVRASNVYASAESSNSGVAPKKLTNLTLEHGCIYDGPIKFWGPPYPNSDMLKGLQFLDVRKQQEGGNLAAAVVNRDDSRKTAAELNMAQQETNKLSSVQIALFSNFCLSALGFQWAIVQNLALQGVVSLLSVSVPNELGQMTTQNNTEILEKSFDIGPAGDIDVVRRQERIQKRFMLMPMVQQIPQLALAILKDTLRDVLPEEAKHYIEIIDQSAADQTQMIIALASMLQQAVTGPDGKLKPEFAEFAPQLQQVQQMVQQLTQQQQMRQGATKPGASGGNAQQNMMQNNMMSQQMSNANNGGTSTQ